MQKWDIENDHAPKRLDGTPHYWLNVGSNYEISIFDLAKKVADIIGFDGEIIWDHSKPDGTPRKKLDSIHINNLGWQAKTNLESGIKNTLDSFKNELREKIIRF